MRFWPRRRSSGSLVHPPQPSSLVSDTVCAAFIGLLLGLLDFFLFELRVDPLVAKLLLLGDAAILSLHRLSTQLLTLILLSILFLLFATLVKNLLRKFTLLRPITVPIVLSTISVVSMILLMRILKNSDQPVKLTILLILCTVLVFYSYRYHRSNIGNDNRQTAPFVYHANFQAIFIVLLFASLPILLHLSTYYSRFTPPTRAGIAVGPNVLMVVLDTLRADRLSCYGRTPEVTPHIDRIAEESYHFLNAFSAAPWTVPSHASMFTGLHTADHHADWGNTHLQAGFSTLAERLGETGYRTVGFSENVFVGPASGLDQGFLEFYEIWRDPLLVRALSRLASRTGAVKQQLEYAPRTLRIARRWLAARHPDDPPFFAYVNLMAAHLPRYPRHQPRGLQWTAEDLDEIQPVNLVPERYYLPEYRLDNRQLAIMREIYDQQVQYLDHNIGQFVDFLERENILDNTVLIITSDHGENFGEHGFVEHQFCLYDSLLHVPLIIRLPAGLKARQVETNVSTVFLFDLILRLSSASERAESLYDVVEHILREKETRPVIAEFKNAVDMLKRTLSEEAGSFDFTPFDRDGRCIIEGDFKYSWNSTGFEELYNIGQDPGESSNLIHSLPDRALEMSTVLTRSLTPDSSPTAPDAPTKLDTETEDALRALGYVR